MKVGSKNHFWNCIQHNRGEIKITCITVGNDKKAIIVYRQYDCVSRKFKEKNKKFYFVIYTYVAK